MGHGGARVRQDWAGSARPRLGSARGRKPSWRDTPLPPESGRSQLGLSCVDTRSRAPAAPPLVGAHTPGSWRRRSHNLRDSSGLVPGMKLLAQHLVRARPGRLSRHVPQPPAAHEGAGNEVSPPPLPGPGGWGGVGPRPGYWKERARFSPPSSTRQTNIQKTSFLLLNLVVQT